MDKDEEIIKEMIKNAEEKSGEKLEGDMKPIISELLVAVRKQGREEALNILIDIHNYCLDMRTKVGRSILDDFDFYLIQSIKKAGDGIRWKLKK